MGRTVERGTDTDSGSEQTPTVESRGGSDIREKETNTSRPERRRESGVKVTVVESLRRGLVRRILSCLVGVTD